MLLALLPAVAAFRPMVPRTRPPAHRMAPGLHGRSVIKAVAVPDTLSGDATPPRISPHFISVVGNNVEVTPSMQEHIHQKLENVIAKHSRLVKSCEVHLTVVKNKRVKEPHTCEVTLHVKGLVIKSRESAESMYTAMDLCASSLKRKLRKFKERRQGRTHDQAKISLASVGAGADEDEESLLIDAMVGGVVDAVESEFADAEANTVVKDKKFNMDPISVDEAVLCLDYIDHDFYVFRNRDTLEVNVVYKRNHGGVGLIQPE